MKICYIANIRLPTEKAHGIQTMKTCEAFADLGHEVELVVPNRQSDISEDPFSYYGVRSNFKIIKLWCVDTVEFGFAGFLLEWFSFAEVVFWREFFKKKDIYYGRDYLSLLYLSLFGRKTVWETHTGEWNLIIKLLAKINHKMVAISAGLKEFYVSKGIPEDKIIVSHDAVDLAQFETSVAKEESRQRLGINTNLPVIMYVGSLGLWKGLETLLNASKELGGKAKVIVIGGSEKEVTPLKEKYKEVSFLGYHPYKELPINQKAADVLVVSNTAKDTISAKYTSPLKVFAHMVSGIPIVSSDLPSLREVLNENNAYFAKADDSHSFAEIIKKVIGESSTAFEKSRRAKLDAKNYTWQKRAEYICGKL